MALIAVTGGTGTLGQNLAPTALARGHEVRVLSRRPGASVAAGADLAVADVVSGRGLDRALAGAEVVVHAATSPLRRARTTEIEGTRKVVEAAHKAGAHLIYVSIVGIDHHHFPYYRAKLAAEKIAAACPASWAIARATQFHHLLDRVLAAPVLPVTQHMRFQPVDPGEFAAWLCQMAETRARGRAPDFGGPEVLPIRELRSIRMQTSGRSALLLPAPPIGFLRDFDRGLHLAPGNREGSVTWEQWLRGQCHTGRGAGRRPSLGLRTHFLRNAAVAQVGGSASSMPPLPATCSGAARGRPGTRRSAAVRRPAESCQRFSGKLSDRALRRSSYW